MEDRPRRAVTRSDVARTAGVSTAVVSYGVNDGPRNVAPAFHDLVTSYFARRGRPARIVQEAIQMQTIISLVSAGLGVALVPASLRNLARAGVRYVELEDPPTLETGLAWRRDDETPTLREMLRLLELQGT